MYNSSESLLLRTVPTPLIGSLDKSLVPSISHCTGTGKLLGEFYGKALCEAFRITERRLRKILSDLSVLMRTFIVLDDHIKDRASENSGKEVIERWLSNIKTEAIAAIEKLGDNGEMLWERYFAQYEESYYNYFKRNAYESTLMKCSFLFLPFELSICRDRKSQSTKMKKAVGYYLFSLQLLDDFHDMEEDSFAPNNHNLFTAKLAEKYREKVIKGRSVLIRSLLSFIASNLKIVLNSSSGSKTFDRYVTSGIRWLASIRPLFMSCPNVSIFWGTYYDYCFDDKTVKPLSRELLGAQAIDVSIIRAEAMHTA